MHEVRVESLDKLETQGTRMPLPADAGSPHIIFPQYRPLLQGDDFCRS